MRILLVAVGLPLVEIALFVIVGRWIGVLPVLALVVLAAVLGVLLMKSAGGSAGRKLRAAMQGRENPLLAAGSAAFRVVAGLLLIVPGFFTDLVALALLLPPVQAALLARVAAQALRRGRRTHHAEVIDGEAVEAAPPPPGQDPSGWTRH